MSEWGVEKVEDTWWRFSVWPIGKKERDIDSEAAREKILGRGHGGGGGEGKYKNKAHEWLHGFNGVEWSANSNVRVKKGAITIIS